MKLYKQITDEQKTEKCTENKLTKILKMDELLQPHG